MNVRVTPVCTRHFIFDSHKKNNQVESTLQRNWCPGLFELESNTQNSLRSGHIWATAILSVGSKHHSRKTPLAPHWRGEVFKANPLRVLPRESSTDEWISKSGWKVYIEHIIGFSMVQTTCLVPPHKLVSMFNTFHLQHFAYTKKNVPLQEPNSSISRRVLMHVHLYISFSNAFVWKSSDSLGSDFPHRIVMTSPRPEDQPQDPRRRLLRGLLSRASGKSMKFTESQRLKEGVHGGVFPQIAKL